MGKQGKPAKKNRKKEFRNSVIAKLEMALSDLKKETEAKKFTAAIKKGGKLLSSLLYVKKKKQKPEKNKKTKTKELTAPLPNP